MLYHIKENKLIFEWTMATYDIFEKGKFKLMCKEIERVGKIFQYFVL